MEDHKNNLIAQRETISQLNSTIKQNDESTATEIATLKNEKEALSQINQKMSREVARLLSVDAELRHREIELGEWKVKQRKAADMVSSYH